MALFKNYPEKGKKCKVTFELSTQAAENATKVQLVGDFNNWSSSETPLKKDKNGNYSVTLSLDQGKEYQFRYLIDNSRWENDWAADKYIHASFSHVDNSVVIV